MNGVSAGAINGANIPTHDSYGPSLDESSRNAGTARNARPRTTQRPNASATAIRKTSGDSATQSRSKGAKKDGSSKSKNGQNKSNGWYVHESDEDIPENMYRPDKDEALEGWIHREKLAKIESEELQAAGINLANQRTRSQRSQPDKNAEQKRDEKRQRVQSPVQEEEDAEQVDWDPRTPEEIAADQSASSVYNNPGLRKSGSKIPVMSSSPIPVPAERYERDTPIPRKRTASGSMSLDSDIITRQSRSPSVSKALDEAEVTSATTGSKPGSPTKARPKAATSYPPTTAAAGKVTPSGQRKASVPSNSKTSPQRPSTRSGEGERPRTASNPPEGDPPWLATMYKPDPRLPPDQQIIPTLARKQQQAQWAESGAIPSTYDREFTPLAVHTEDGLVKAPSPTLLSSEKAKEDQSKGDEIVWPLKASDSVRSNSGRPGTSGSLSGGYSTMPKVTSPTFRSSSPKIGTGPTPTTAPGRSAGMAPPSRIQEMPIEQDDTVKKGCGCCIVM